MNTAHFTFYGTLNFFLTRRHKYTTFSHKFDWKASIKDMIESLGPPHPEVELLIVNGESVSWDYIVQPDDVVKVYPDYQTVGVTANKIRLFPPYPGRPRFILDTHLGRLASYLRMMGFDTLYRNDFDDDELAQISHDDKRILLTRDIGVLKRGIVVYGYYVRNTNPQKRLHEISERYKLAYFSQPFKHCMKCNGLLKAVEKHAILDQIKPNTAEHFDTFHQCQSCERIYWKGSHYQKMARLINEVVQED